MKSLNFKKIDAVRDWKIILCLFALGLIFLSLFSLKIYLSSQIGGGYLGEEIAPIDTSIKMIDQKKLDASISLLENRSVEQLKPIDPSL
jgi:hypothetical protein